MVSICYAHDTTVTINTSYNANHYQEEIIHERSMRKDRANTAAAAAESGADRDEGHEEMFSDDINVFQVVRQLKLAVRTFLVCPQYVLSTILITLL